MDSTPNIINARSLIAIIKQRFHNQEIIFKEFRDLLEEYRRGCINPQNLVSQVQILFNGHTDLISFFRNFMPKNDRDSTDVRVSTTLRKSCYERKKTEDCIEFMNRVAKTLRNDYKYKLFLDAVNGHGEHKDIDRVHEEVHVIFKDHPELDIEFSRFLKDFFETKSRVEDKVFSGSGGLRKINRYEQILFNCEDEMYKFDMEYHSLKSTMEAMDKMVEELEKEKVTVYMEEYLSVLNLKSLKDLFGSNYVSKIKGNPIDANDIEAMSLRLNKKYTDLEKYRERAKIKWARTFKENHEKMNIGVMNLGNAVNLTSDPEQVQPVKRIKVTHSKQLL